MTETVGERERENGGKIGGSGRRKCKRVKLSAL